MKEIRFGSKKKFGGKEFIFWTLGSKSSAKSTAKYIHENDRGYTRITKYKYGDKVEYILWVRERK